MPAKEERFGSENRPTGCDPQRVTFSDFPVRAEHQFKGPGHPCLPAGQAKTANLRIVVEKGTAGEITC
jgi:hypothetical protein